MISHVFHFPTFQVIRAQLEEKRPLVEHSLETGRMYLREEGMEDKRLSTDSGEGMREEGMEDKKHSSYCNVLQKMERRYILGRLVKTSPLIP